MNKRGLGKGLGALFDMEIDPETEEINYQREGNTFEILIDRIDPDAEQARKTFPESQMQELVDSIKQHGVIQPILVRQNGTRYVIIAGERRYRAAKSIGLSTIPAIVKSMSEQEYREISLIENLQRENLNALEEADGVKELMEKHGLTQEQIAQRLSKSRSYIANSLRLLSLSNQVKDMLKNGELSPGHARALVVLDEDAQISVAEKIKAEELSVRQVEALIKSMQQPKVDIPVVKALPQELREFQDKLMNIFGTKVYISGDSKTGKIQINYYSADDLERIYEIMQVFED